MTRSQRATTESSMSTEELADLICAAKQRFAVVEAPVVDLGIAVDPDLDIAVDLDMDVDLDVDLDVGLALEPDLSGTVDVLLDAVTVQARALRDHDDARRELTRRYHDSLRAIREGATALVEQIAPGEQVTQAGYLATLYGAFPVDVLSDLQVLMPVGPTGAQLNRLV